MPTILVIDDDQELRDQIVQMLHYEGYQSLTADNGELAIHLAQRYLPDLIVCDVLMPGLNGFGVLEHLRRDQRTAMIPFIFLTGVATPQDMRYGMSLGADDFLPKPFEIADLLAAIRTRLAKQAIAARQVDELRVNLSRSLPHELRTPLVAILGFTEHLLDHDRATFPDIDEILQIQQHIHDSAARLQQLIEKYLLYAQLRLLEHQPDQRRTWQNVDPTGTAVLIKSVAKKILTNSSRHADVTLNVAEADVPIRDDHLWLIISELLENAIKFSEPGTPIDLTTHVTGDQWQFTISDQGRGMTADQISRIDAYMQFDRQYYEQQGMGLGLIITRLLAELYGGELKIISLPEQGTTVSVTLPTKMTWL